MNNFTTQRRSKQSAGATCQTTDRLRRRGDGNAVLVMLVVLAGIVLVLGLVLGWFSFSSTSDEVEPETKTKLSVTVDKAKMKSDVGQAGDKASEAAEEVAMAAQDATEAGKEMAEIETVRGEIVEIDGNRISVLPADSEEPITLSVDENSEIKTVDGNVGTLDDFKEGSHVTAVYNEEEKPYRLKRLAPVATP